MSAYYNEFDPFAAAWLRELIKAGHIAPGDVDERSITDVKPAELVGYDQCHFFAGIGGWSLALRLAGWPDDRPVWTGSCPCQPFSSAGANRGTDDPRHLWPAWFRLIRECRPSTVFGEQVEAAVAHGWLDLVSDDLEREGYAVGAVGLPAASVGAPHIRQRLWFVAESSRERRSSKSDIGREWQPDEQGRVAHVWSESVGQGAVGELADADPAGPVEQWSEGLSAHGHPSRRHDADGRGPNDRMGDSTRGGQRINGRAPRHAGHADEPIALEQLGYADQPRSQGRIERGDGPGECAARAASMASPWADLVWLPCRDGKARPTQSGLFPLAHGIPARVGRLRGYGNAIVPQVAAEVIAAFMECAR